MSWAEEDWTVGLSGRVLQKVKELQVQHDRLSRESRQKQLHLDNTQGTLEKQTVKHEEVRRELLSVQRELQGVREELKTGVSNMQRLSQEVHSKQAQVCSLEGQLDSARTLTHTLSQEVKRLEAELEKMLASSRAADSSSLFSTPCWSVTSPWEHNGKRKDEQPGHLGGTDKCARHARQELQFSDTPSTPLPRQPNRRTPLRHPSSLSDAFSTPSGAFPWERDDSRAVVRGRGGAPSPLTPTDVVMAQGQQELGDCGRELRKENDGLRGRVCLLEAELRAESEHLKASQEGLAQSRKELAARDISLQKGGDQLSLAHMRTAQETDRACAAEQRARLLQEELRCQRRNAESSCLQHLQRTKDLEKQHQRDLLELQKERQCLEKHRQQEVNKVNQEVQQARTLYNTLQAQADKLSLQKQALDKEVDTLKDQLKWTQGQMQESQKKESQTQAKLTEALRAAEGVAVLLEQSRKRQAALEEDATRLAQEHAHALRLLQELRELRDVRQELQGRLEELEAQRTAQAEARSHIQELGRKHTDLAALWRAQQDTMSGGALEGQGEKGAGGQGEELNIQLRRQLEEAKAQLEHQEDERASKQDLAIKLAHLQAELEVLKAQGEAPLEAQGEAPLETQAPLEAKRKTSLEAQAQAFLEAKRKTPLDAQASLEAKRKTSLEAQGEAPLEAQGKNPMEAQGENPLEAQGETPLEAKRKTSLEAQGEAPLEAQASLEAKRTTSLEAQGENPLEAQDKAPLEDHGEVPLEAHSPLSYLSLCDHNLSSNVVALDNKLLPSPDQSQQDLRVSQATDGLIREETIWHAVGCEEACPPAGQEEAAAEGVSQGKTSGPIQTTDLQVGPSARQLERLWGEMAREAGRANQCQAKLEALQAQVARQTQQLTTAFYRQSQHIADLLTELQLKETALHCQEGELQRCQQELAALGAEKEQMEEAGRREHQHEADESSKPHRDGEGSRASPMSLLEHQVGVLQAELHALSKENQRKAEDLAIWRTASQPTADGQQPQGHSVSLAPPENPALGPGEAESQGLSQSSSTVLLIREDQLLLSCTSNKLHGRILATRLQHSSLPEQRDFMDISIDEDSEEENTERNVCTQSKTTTHKRQKRADIIRKASDETTQKNSTNVPHIVSGLQAKAVRLHEEEVGAEQHAPKTISPGSMVLAEGVTHQRSGKAMQKDITQAVSSPIAAREVCHACTQTGDTEDREAPPPTLARLSEGARLGERTLFSGSFPILADPVRLAERIRRSRSQLSAAFDDTEYEPYGLPEVVMKGFADIPSGPACPYIVRRGHLGTAAVPLPPKEPVHVEETD